MKGWYIIKGPLDNTVDRFISAHQQKQNPPPSQQHQNSLQNYHGNFHNGAILTQRGFPVFRFWQRNAIDHKLCAEQNKNICVCVFCYIFFNTK